MVVQAKDSKEVEDFDASVAFALCSFFANP